jgi:hypothetical protein
LPRRRKTLAFMFFCKMTVLTEKLLVNHYVIKKPLYMQSRALSSLNLE